MGMDESDIVYERGDHWVSTECFKGRRICRVWRIAGTHSVRVATVDVGPETVSRAVAECDRRVGA